MDTEVSNGSILIVEDSPTQRHFLQHLLEAHNYKVISVNDAEEALEVIEDIVPELVITDIVMPKMNGYELCSQIKQKKRMSNVPVILLTVLSSSEEMIKGLECGADSFISKPYSENYLITLVNKTINNKELKSDKLIELDLTISDDGRKRSISVESNRIISLMFSAYESALYKNSVLVQTQSELEKRTAELSKQNTVKDKFFSIIAHDLKSPFYGLLGVTEQMAENIGSFTKGELSEFSIELNKSVKNFLKLLENLLEWAQMQQGSVSFYEKEINLSELVSQNIDLITKRCKQKEIKIIQDIDSTHKIFADEAMFNSILRNLLSNAVKFTKHGGNVVVQSRLSEKKMIEISVIDNGIGMSKSLSKKLFKMDEKVGRKGTDGEESTGIGLLLCKEFTEKHGGRIWVESEEARGTTFSFTIPKCL